MPDSFSLWDLRRRALRRAQRHLRAGEPTGLHDIRVALRRVAATAGALGRRKVAGRAKRIVSSLSADRQLEVDRALLARVKALGLISEDAATALGARWESTSDGNGSSVDTAGNERRVRRLERKLRSLAADPQPDALQRLLAARAEVEAGLATAPGRKDDKALHKHRLAVKRARYLAEDLVGCGREEFEAAASREKTAQEALGRWNDVRLFLERIDRERELAEKRGAVRLASELDRFARSLEQPLKSLRAEANDVVRRLAIAPSAAVESA
ncbi:MAG: CHAD domain-containing protein [Acidobacteriota bacterium]